MVLRSARLPPASSCKWRRRVLGSAVTATVARAGAVHAFSALQVPGTALNGRIGLRHDQAHRGDKTPSCAFGRLEASSSAATLGAAVICLLSVAMTPAMPARAETPASAENSVQVPAQAATQVPARAATPKSAESSVQVLGEDGTVLSDEEVAEDPTAPDAPRIRKGFEKRPAPEIPLEERTRRRDTPSKDVMGEIWYKRGKIIFVAKCAGCHPAGMNKIDQTKTLYWDDLERNGYRDFDKMTKVIRYGLGKMPGYAEDCTKVQDFKQCGVISPIDDESLMDVQDFMINRANDGWKGRG